jgi:hypothetical protein
MLYYRRGGNFDRIRAYGITLAYSNGMARTVVVGTNRLEDEYESMYNKKRQKGSRMFGSHKGHFQKTKFGLFR